MNLWQKIKKGLEQGTSTVSEKAAEQLKDGAKVVKEDAGKVSEKTVYASKLAKLKWEQRGIEKAILGELTKLGGKLYNLFCGNSEMHLKKGTQEDVQRLRSLEQDL